MSPVDERGDVPDPIVEIEKAALAKWQAIFAAADGNRDAALSRSEWPEERIEAEMPALNGVSFELWDRDGSGTVTVEEGAGLLEVAYGLRRPDGRLLRTAKGLVLSWNYIRLLDRDGDGGLSRDEFVPKYLLGEAKNAARFSELDADQNGRLDDDEMAPAFWRDTLGEFLGLDADRDGRLTTEDILKFGYAEGIGRRTVRACDDDGDGKLSFIEFRATPFENPSSDWYAPRRDADNDGRLSWKEFYTEKPPLLIGQNRFIFDRFDRNHDGFLSVLEFTIEGDALQGQLMTYIEPLERRLPLELGFARRVCGLSDEQAAALERAGRNALESIAIKLAATGRQNNALLAVQVVRNGRALMVPRGANEELVHTPHLWMRRELSEALHAPSGKLGATGAEAEAW
ncbi:MAG: hypothetical protein ACREHD_26695, partial [Pirellulales bacterium]